MCVCGCVCVCMCVCFLSELWWSKLPGKWPYENETPPAPREHFFSGPRSDQLDPSPLLSLSLLLRPFNLAAKELGVRARHFSIFGRPPSGHLRIFLFLLRGCMWARIQANICPHAHTSHSAPQYWQVRSLRLLYLNK